MELQPETILKNRYRIIGLLGKGGMGAVYLGFDQNLEIQVAIKSNRNPNPESTTQFLQEARLLAALHHPNLPRVIDHFILDGDEYLVMDYIVGRDLQDVIEEDGCLPLDQVLVYARQLGDAVNFLHTQNPPIIHRDIKPANIKLDDKGNCILVDFGIAKAGNIAQATSAGAKGFTPGYAPPEQYGSSRTGPYSDQYALAATLFHLLTGQRPADSVQRALGNAILTSMNLLLPGIPAHIQRAFERALEIRPENRFASVDDFTRSLLDPGYQAHESGFGVQPTQRNKKKSSHRWIWFGLGGVMLLGLVTIGAIVLLRLFGSPLPHSTQISPAVTESASQTEPLPSETPAAAAVVVTDTLEPRSTPTEAPTLSPTPAVESIGGGGKIAFISDRSEDGIEQIWSMNVFLDANGTLISDEPQQITFDTFNKSQPAWSPDGSKLVYVAEGPADSGSQGQEIWLLDYNKPDVAAKNLTYMKGNDYDPIFSPDGSYIAFTNQGRYTETRQIYFMTPDGREVRRLSNDFEEHSPLWSSDMKTLITVIEAGDHSYLFQHVWVGDTLPTPFPTPRPYDKTTIFGQLGEVSDPVISPDGSYIAYARINGRQYQLYSMETRTFGEKKLLLTADTAYNRWPEWSPDGQWIIFTSIDSEPDEEIYIMTSTGLMKTNLTQNQANDRQPAWQPAISD
jgi:eukaryotic-like serine/threonine-protein kinase